MLMPNVVDLLAGRNVGLPVPDELDQRSQHASPSVHPRGMVRRMARGAARLLSLLL